MGINNLLPHLPGGDRYFHSFYDLKIGGRAVVLDAAGALWQFAATHARDHLGGNYDPAMVEWGHFLNYLRSLCGWELWVFMDGRENPHKGPEIERRRKNAEKARDENNLTGQVKNTPEYIAAAMKMCNHLKVKARVSAYEADPQVTYEALSKLLVLMTGDSDVFAYEKEEDEVNESGEPIEAELEDVIIVQSFRHQHYRIISLTADVPKGNLPLYDLYREHGKIVFQLYAACSGCDFTPDRCGIRGIGFETFVSIAANVEGDLSAASLAVQLWQEKEAIVRTAGFKSSKEVEGHLQKIVDVYTKHGRVYDENSNIIDLSGNVQQEATERTRRHMEGKLDSRSEKEFSETLKNTLNSMKCDQLVHCSVADVTTIRGAQLSNGKRLEDCTVSELRDFCAARGGKITGTKSELVKKAKAFQLLEQEVQINYVDRNPDPNGCLYTKINTSSTLPVRAILAELALKSGAFDQRMRDLIKETLSYFDKGLFDDKYDNIARVAPEMKEGFLYGEFGHIGSSIHEKNIADALRRCWYDNSTSYHGICFVPDSDDRVIILTKARASMRRDEKTRNLTEEGEAPMKAEYLLIMELRYHKTDEIADGHGLGVFVELLRTYCTDCVAGQGCCRHKSERLWYQYHHWTNERLGIEKPATLEVCSWAPGGRVLCSDVRQKIYSQQTVKYVGSLKAQKEKIKRGAKRNCTEGNSCEYQVHRAAAKQAPMPNRFSKQRVSKLFKRI